MGNSYADTSLFQDKVNLQDRDEVHSFLLDVLRIDNDLTENVEYFEVDDDGNLLCESQGFECDAEMYVANIIKGKDMNTPKLFEEVFKEVLGILEKQDYFGYCPYEIHDNKDGTVIVAYVVGGESRW